MRFDGKTNKQIATYVKLDELSGVTVGAQEGADVTIIKTQDEETLVKNLFDDAVNLMGDRDEMYAIVHKVWDYTDALYDVAVNIIQNISDYPDPIASFGEVLKSFADAVVSLKKNKDDKEAKETISLIVKTKKLKVMKIIRDFNEAESANNPQKETEMSKSTEDTKVADDAKVEEMQKQIDLLTSLSKMSDAQKTHYSALDEVGQTTFLKLDDDARQLAIDNSAADDPVVYTSKLGTEFRKSDDPRMIELSKQADAANARADTAEKQTVQATLVKRAGIELSHVPGEEEDKVALLKAIDTITSVETKKGVMGILAAQNGGMQKSFEVQGSTAMKKTEDANEALDNMSKAHQDKHSVSYEAAYDAVLQTKEGQELYNQM